METAERSTKTQLKKNTNTHVALWRFVSLSSSDRIPLNPDMDRKINWQGAKSAHVGKICVCTDEDTTDCWITGIALLPVNSIIETDFDNRTVKLIDLHRQTVTSRLQLPAIPWNVTVVSRDEVAITLYVESDIQFSSTRGGLLSCTRSFKVNGRCHAIDYNRDKLFVSYCFSNQVKIEILSLQGEVLQCFTTGTRGQPLFKCPYYLTTTQYSIYVSDFNTHSVTKLSHHGEVIDSFIDENASYSKGLFATSDGHILVCNQNRGGNIVSTLTSDLSKVGELDVKGNVGFSQAVCYNQDINTLYITSFTKTETDHYIHMFKIT